MNGDGGIIELAIRKGIEHMARLRLWATLTAGAGLALANVCASVQAQPVQAPTSQGRVANAFLTALDRGDVFRAALLLHPSIKGRIDPRNLIGTAQQRARSNVRRLTYEGRLSSRFGKSDQTLRRFASTVGYIVCYLEVPHSGNGSISFVSVTLLPATVSEGWQISNYRVQPYRSSDCPI